MGLVYRTAAPSDHKIADYRIAAIERAIAWSFFRNYRVECNFEAILYPIRTENNNNASNMLSTEPNTGDLGIQTGAVPWVRNGSGKVELAQILLPRPACEDC